MQVVYDNETFPNLFSVAMTPLTLGDDREWVYEISPRKNDLPHLVYDLRSGSMLRMVGFNNLAFDYPLLHHAVWMSDAGYADAGEIAFGLFTKAQEIIAMQNAWDSHVKPWEVIVPQLDLMLLHHFDNRAKMTSLKVIEFNMQSPSVEDMPFPVGTWLTDDQIPIVLDYNKNDTRETKRFAHKSMAAIEFREQLVKRKWFGPEVINYNDAKIGKEYFKKRLEERQPGITKIRNGKKPQTHRPQIRLAECIFPYVQFDRPELREMRERLRGVTFSGYETKNAYKESVTLDGFTIDIGQGGVHGSVNNQTIRADAGRVIIDIDVRGYYPGIIITNWIYPEHLGEAFCHEFRYVKETRDIAKDAGLLVEAGTLKLASNGVFGDFGNVHSIFYDPQALIKTTINGQLMLTMLAEQLMRIPSLEMIQMNTDGLTVRVHAANRHLVDTMCTWWENVTKLQLEFNEYAVMAIRDTNNYLAVDTKGKRKRKGAYDWEMLSGSTGGQLAWNRDFSGLVIPKAAEAALIDDTDPAWFIEHHTEPYDFLMRARVTGGSKLQLADGTPLPKTVRYYISTDGQPLVKIMPPLKGFTEPRRIGIHAEGQATCTGERKTGYRCSKCAEQFGTKAVFEAHNKQVHAWGITPRNRWDGDLSGLDARFYVTEAERLIF